MKIKYLALVLAAAVFCVSQASAETYTIDAGHSSLGFSVKHMEISKTKGQFDDFSGTITYDPDLLTKFSADVKIQAVSINTHLEGRDKHLRTGDFFHVEKFPEITFKSIRLEKRGEGKAIIGDLTMKGVTKEVTIPVTISGPVAGAIGISGFTTINRQDFGVVWNKTLDSGGFAVGNDVELLIEIEAKEESSVPVVAEAAK